MIQRSSSSPSCSVVFRSRLCAGHSSSSTVQISLCAKGDRDAGTGLGLLVALQRNCNFKACRRYSRLNDNGLTLQSKCSLNSITFFLYIFCYIIYLVLLIFFHEPLMYLDSILYSCSHPFIHQDMGHLADSSIFNDLNGQTFLALS